MMKATKERYHIYILIWLRKYYLNKISCLLNVLCSKMTSLDWLGPFIIGVPKKNANECFFFAKD